MALCFSLQQQTTPQATPSSLFGVAVKTFSLLHRARATPEFRV